jgi:hypothetical protein
MNILYTAALIAAWLGATAMFLRAAYKTFRRAYQTRHKPIMPPPDVTSDEHNVITGRGDIRDLESNWLDRAVPPRGSSHDRHV